MTRDEACFISDVNGQEQLLGKVTVSGIYHNSRKINGREGHEGEHRRRGMMEAWTARLSTLTTTDRRASQIGQSKTGGLHAGASTEWPKMDGWAGRGGEQYR
jgi:hypothetical protein